MYSPKTFVIRKIFKAVIWGMTLLLLALVLYEMVRVITAQKTVDEKFKTILEQEDSFVSIADIPKGRLDALLQIEDPNFYNHKGIDLKTHGAGLTTISQALTKRLFFKNFNPGFAKLEQSLIARFAVHPAISKDEQILAFFSIAYLGACRGRPVHGFRPAARCYFDKEFEDLSRGEFLRLSAMLVGPNHYNPLGGVKALEERVMRIENLLAKNCAPLNNRDVYLAACVN